MKRPTSDVTKDSINPSLSNAVELYTNKQREAHKCIQERDEYINYLESKLSSAKPQQALPVVPEYVAEFIERYKDRRTIYGVFDKIPKNRKPYHKLYEWVFKDENSQATFALAFITGKYQVEKPQLFYLREKNTGYYLHKTGNNSYGITPQYSNDSDKKYMHYKFTQSEIDSMETGSYELVPVEDEK